MNRRLRPVAMTLRRSARRSLRPIRGLVDRLAGSVKGAATDDPVVAFTFDDGPDAEATPAIAEILEAHGATATFFVLADRAERHPAVLKRLLAEGHEIGLHGARHTRLTTASLAETIAVIRGGRHRLEQVTGRAVRWFRPPFGAQSVTSYAVARLTRLEVVGWSASAADWLDGGGDRVAAALADLRPGGIVMLHDRYESDPLDVRDAPEIDRVALLGSLLQGIDGRGWRAMDLSRMLDGRGVRRSAWFKSPPAR
ncbi:MAG: hypothetical protein QOJ67_3833 [Acidimicrobiaceae bacterium]